MKAKQHASPPNFFRHNGLSVVLLLLFVVCLVGQILAGRAVYDEELLQLGFNNVSLAEYLHSGHFIEATFENWESEFLQMALFVVITVFLYQKGSSESKDPDHPEKRKKDEQKFQPKYFLSSPVLRAIYKSSLSLALFALFVVSFFLHLLGGLRHENLQHLAHGEAQESIGEFLRSAQFWFQSFQNWQSEFLSVAVLVLLSIVLRQEGSPQSKPVDAPHSKTGED